MDNLQGLSIMKGVPGRVIQGWGEGGTIMYTVVSETLTLQLFGSESHVAASVALK